MKHQLGMVIILLSSTFFTYTYASEDNAQTEVLTSDAKTQQSKQQKTDLSTLSNLPPMSGM